MSRVSLTERLKIAHSLALFRRLETLDGLWTDYVQAGEPLAEDERETAQQLLQEMDELLAQCAQAAGDLRGQVQVHSEVVTQVIQTIIGENTPRSDVPPVPSEAREYWKHILDVRERDAGKLVSFVLSALAEDLSAELDRVREQLDRIRRGEPKQADLPARDICYMGIAVTVFAGLVGAWPIAFVSAAGWGGYCGYHRVFNGE